MRYPIIIKNGQASAIQKGAVFFFFSIYLFYLIYLFLLSFFISKIRLIRSDLDLLRLPILKLVGQVKR